MTRTIGGNFYFSFSGHNFGLPGLPILTIKSGSNTNPKTFWRYKEFRIGIDSEFRRIKQWKIVWNPAELSKSNSLPWNFWLCRITIRHLHEIPSSSSIKRQNNIAHQAPKLLHNSVPCSRSNCPTVHPTSFLWLPYNLHGENLERSPINRPEFGNEVAIFSGRVEDGLQNII